MKVVKTSRILLLLLHIIVGVGAVAGGMGAILDPIAPAGANASLLKTGPFETFLIPGIILFTLFGLGNLAAAIWLMTHWRQPEKGTLVQGYVTGILGGAMVIWIVVQCVMLQMVVELHIIMFVVGIVQGFLAFKLLWDRDAFPVNVIRRVLTNSRLCDPWK